MAESSDYARTENQLKRMLAAEARSRGECDLVKSGSFLRKFPRSPAATFVIV